jgi:predicted ArsR family transcriptional regulator
MRGLAHDPDDDRRRVHRALANVNRVRLMRLLEDGPQVVSALTRATGLHANTVRAHLDVLVDGGLVEREKCRAKVAGRPAWTYRLASEA